MIDWLIDENLVVFAIVKFDCLDVVKDREQMRLKRGERKRIDWLNDWLIGWLVDWLIYQSESCCVHDRKICLSWCCQRSRADETGKRGKKTDWLIKWLINWLIGWLIDLSIRILLCSRSKNLSVMMLSKIESRWDWREGIRMEWSIEWFIDWLID